MAAAAPPPAPPPPVQAPEAFDEQAELDKGRNAYRAQKFDEADARFLKMLDPEHGTLHDKVLIKQARMYRAATLIALHHEEEAQILFKLILTDDHEYEPDPLAFPTEVANAFYDTRSKLRQELEEAQRELYRRAAERRAHEEEARRQEAARLKQLEQLASQSFITQKHSRWTALLPFGIGQFQNGQRTAGWFFLVSEGVALGTGIATVPIYYVDLANANSIYPTNPSAAAEYDDRAVTVRDINLASYAALAALAIVGAVQAEAAFVPEKVSIEPRAIPDLPPPPPRPSATLPFFLGTNPVPGRDGRGVSGGTLTLGATF
jgi:hypothetical protein